MHRRRAVCKVREEATRRRQLRAAAAHRERAVTLNVEPQKILKHRSLMNVNGIREGRKGMRRERLGGETRRR